jgi:hypothetical protein
MHCSPSKYRSNATRFNSYKDARDWAALHVKGWPAWEIAKRGDNDYVVALQPGGPWALVER